MDQRLPVDRHCQGGSIRDHNSDGDVVAVLGPVDEALVAEINDQPGRRRANSGRLSLG